MLASHVFMVRPACFGFNAEAAQSNGFANAQVGVAEQARVEWEGVVARLEQAGISVVIGEDDASLGLADAIFPNNWFSSHPDKMLVLYPMAVANRRAEARAELIDQLVEYTQSTRVIDLRELANKGNFCEGTGSLVFDHAARAAFAAISPRTTRSVVEEVASILGYTSIIFEAYLNNQPFYHTNVALAFLPGLQVISERIANVPAMGRDRLWLNDTQVNAFAGNMLALSGTAGPITLLSKTAWETLSQAQRKKIPDPVIVEISTIERVGGGGARCMVAELFSC